MSSICLRPALLLAVSSVWAASPAIPPELNGILVTGKDHRFALVGSGGGYFHWAGLGETVDGWKLVDYVSSDDVVVLSRDGQEVTVRLRTSTVGETGAASSNPATVANADEVLTKMKFEAMWDRIAGEQEGNHWRNAPASDCRVHQDGIAAGGN